MKAIIIYYADERARKLDEVEGGIYTNISCDDLVKDYGITEENILYYVPFTVTGKTYEERQQDLRNKAIKYQSSWYDYCGFSYGELADIQEFFEVNGRRYGLLREFHENGIC